VNLVVAAHAARLRERAKGCAYCHECSSAVAAGKSLKPSLAEMDNKT
jgi:hypothetical protein